MCKHNNKRITFNIQFLCGMEEAITFDLNKWIKVRWFECKMRLMIIKMTTKCHHDAIHSNFYERMRWVTILLILCMHVSYSQLRKSKQKLSHNDRIYAYYRQINLYAKIISRPVFHCAVFSVRFTIALSCLRQCTKCTIINCAVIC